MDQARRAAKLITAAAKTTPHALATCRSPAKGPSINDVTLIFHIFGTLPPFVTHSRNLSVLFIRKIGQFLNPPPPPLERDVIYEWSLSVLDGVHFVAVFILSAEQG